MEWISVEDSLPKEVGQYWCKNDTEEFPCFWVRRLDGIKIWLKYSDDLVITHWREKGIRVKDIKY